MRGEMIESPTVLARLEGAANAHDLNALVACFAPDYRNDTPAHPERSFTGREQVRRNWEQIFAFIPDITATVLLGGQWRRSLERVGAPGHAARRIGACDARGRDFRSGRWPPDVGALLP